MQRSIVFFLLVLINTRGLTQEAPPGAPVRLVSDLALSPDGQWLAFSWRGDIWVVPATGGVINRMTTHAQDDREPEFAPDGDHLAFVSDRTGSPQIFITDRAREAPRAITVNTDGHRLLQWTATEGLLTQGARDHFWRDAERFFLEPTEGEGAPRLLFDDHGGDGCLSPDGKTLLFVREGAPLFRKRYRGSQDDQIWAFDRTLGTFAKLHSEPGGARWPLFLPDGRSYLYVSQDTGTWNLYRCSLDHDGREQLTEFEDDGVLLPCISRDGSTVAFQRGFDVYRLDLSSRELSKIALIHRGDPTVDEVQRPIATSATSAAFTEDGREIAFVAEGDVFVMDTELREPVRITDTPEEERNPIFLPDHSGLIFESDAGGRSDLWIARRTDATTWWWRNERFELTPLTSDEAVESRAKLLPNGNQLAYVRGLGDLMVMDLSTSTARCVFESWNAPSFDFSPDSCWVVYALDDDDFNSDIWIRPLDDHRQPFNVSCHPDNDGDPKWSPDGKRIVFTGRRWDAEVDIVVVNLRREDEEESDRDRRLEKALEKMKGRTDAKPQSTEAKPIEPPLTDAVSGSWKGQAMGPDPIPESGLPFELTLKLLPENRVSGAYVSRLGRSQLTGTFDPTKGTFRLTGDADGQSLTIVGSLVGEAASGTWTAGPVDGTWMAERIRVPAAETPPASKPKGATRIDVVIDFEGLRDRLRRVPIPESREGALLFDTKGEKLYFRATVQGKAGVHSIEFPASFEPKFVAATFGSRPRFLSDGKTLADSGPGAPSTYDLSGKKTSYEFSVAVTRSLGEFHRVIFDQAWRTLRDRYYDGALGNTDWSALRAKYGAVASECLTPGDLSRVVNMLLGELNGSHLGFRMGGGPVGDPPAREWTHRTGHLGARLAPAPSGDGFLVRDVVEQTPAAETKTQLVAGDVIVAVDGVRVDPERDPALYFTIPRDRDVSLAVRDPAGMEREVTLRPTTAAAVRGRLYERWIQSNREAVDGLSKGRLGYLHIQGMGQPNLVRFDTELHRVGHGKDGLVIDVRENGGGSITDHLLTCLCQPAHAITRPRGGGEGYPQDRRVYATWDRPIVVLCNQNSFSNAEIFSHAIKTLGRGRVVGVPTAGGVISTGGTTLFGGAFLRLPFRGWYLLDGEDMELNGCVPDFVVWPEPGEIPAGKDRQLEKAVEVLLADVAIWETRPRPRLRRAMERFE